MQQSVFRARGSRVCLFRWVAALGAGLCVSSGVARAAAADPGTSQAPSQAGTAAEPAAKKREVIVLRADKVIVRPGQVLEGASVLIEDGVITQVGKIVTPPDGAREIRGKVVCAGFIDPWSIYGIDAESAADQRNSPSAATSDALDGFLDPRLRKDVLRAGITSVRTQMGVLARVGGIGSALRMNAEGIQVVVRK